MEIISLGVALIALALVIHSRWQSSMLFADLNEARKPNVVRKVADLAAAVAEIEERQQTQHGRLWGRVGHLERKVNELYDDDGERVDGAPEAPSGESDEQRRSRLRRELLPKDMAGKVATMREGLAQSE